MRFPTTLQSPALLDFLRLHPSVPGPKPQACHCLLVYVVLYRTESLYVAKTVVHNYLHSTTTNNNNRLCDKTPATERVADAMQRSGSDPLQISPSFCTVPAVGLCTLVLLVRSNLQWVRQLCLLPCCSQLVALNPRARSCSSFYRIFGSFREWAVNVTGSSKGRIHQREDF